MELKAFAEVRVEEDEGEEAPGEGEGKDVVHGGGTI